MTYFGFLLRFLVIPILLFAGLDFLLTRRRQITNPVSKWPILLIVLIAVLYTTPWDNYLVATGVWWYDPALVTGLVIGWVPIEEYTFFVLQPIMVGLWLILWMRVFSMHDTHHAFISETGSGKRGAYAAGVGVIWLVSAVVLFSGWKPGTYLGLELVWALPPVILQLAFGADILRRHWKLVLMGIIPPTLYLSAMDAVAIFSGTWTIDPEQSTGLMLGGVLPVEEFLFFLLTNILVTLGLVLVWAPESQARLASWREKLSRKRNRRLA